MTSAVKYRFQLYHKNHLWKVDKQAGGKYGHYTERCQHLGCTASRILSVQGKVVSVTQQDNSQKDD